MHLRDFVRHCAKSLNDQFTYHQVLRATLRPSVEFDMPSFGSPMASAVRTAIPQYM
jgi:hypothetical protein